MHETEFSPSRLGRSRMGVLFLVAALTFIAAFLLPLPEKLLDVLWVGSFCLSGAVTIICVVAQSSSDLIGFVPMISGLTLLRLVTQTGTARHIIRDEPAGTLLGHTGSILTAVSPLGAVLVCLLLAVVIVFAVFMSCQRVASASTGYLRKILPLKRMGIETDLRLGVIDDNHAKGLAQRVILEARFFFNMNRTAVLMRTEAVVCVLILLGCLVFPAANHTIDRPSGVGLLHAVAGPVVALSVFTLIPSVIVAAACGALMGKDSLALRTEADEAAPLQAKKIKVVALDSEEAEGGALLNADFVRSKGLDEQVVEFEPQARPSVAAAGPVSMDISCRNAKEYYEKLSRAICTIGTLPRIILLASDKVCSLPVTVAVNIAIRLAQKKQKVLLVDTAPTRNAVGNVFELDLESMRKKVQPSCLENLSVCCVPAERVNSFLRKGKLFGHFDTTLIYTPNIPTASADKEGCAAKPGVFYFTDDENSDAARAATEKLAFCDWFSLVPSIQSVLDSKP